MNLKDKADSILSGHVSSEDGIIELYTDSRVDALAAMIEFAKLACEEQKKLCADNANWHYDENGRHVSIEENILASQSPFK